MWGSFNDLLATTTVQSVTVTINGYVKTISIVFLSICALCVTLFAIWVGFNMAKADDDGKRQQAKSQLIYSIIGIISIAAIATMLGAVIPALSNMNKGNAVVDNSMGLKDTYDAIKAVVDSIITLLTTAAVVFAVYLGWQLMKAEDDAKRKNAKMQLMYTIIGIVGIVLINTVAVSVITAITPR